jgi:subtilisin family serine protease
MKLSHVTFGIALMVLLSLGVLLIGSPAVHAEKIKIEKADDIPPHAYKITMKAVELVENEKAVKKLAKKIQGDLEKDLEKYDIEDKTTLKEYYANLGMIALVGKRFDDYLKYLEMRRELEDKEAARLTTGLFARAYIKAAQSGNEDMQAAFKREYTALVTPLPYDVVGSDLESTKGRAEIFSKNLFIGIINEQIQPIIDKNKGEVDKDNAMSLVSFYYIFNMYLPHKNTVVEVLSAYLDAHKVVKPDIWEEREVTLDETQKAKPVMVGIWDAGVDMEVFRKVAFINEKEIPGNGLDDDGNGYVDDVHGIAYDIYANKTLDLLYPIGDIADRPRLQGMIKGFTDLTSNIDSEEATALKKKMSTLDPSEVKPFIEDIGKYGNHCHGTHVAGITARGNPYARILAARLSFDHRMIPMEPTVEWAKRASRMMVETAEYFKQHGVRVVNMSWGYTLDEIEVALEANGAGGTVEERKELTRKIFDIIDKGLYAALEGAPDILFIGGAGNADNDVEFAEFIPSAYDLPNLMSIGAVDQAGDETDFTSFGKVDAYANGFEVLSYVPGGDQIELSGTSMASPNVANLAAKLVAVHPELKPAQVRALIIKGCDEKKAGDRTVRLINPRKSFALLRQMK